jgi:hypothetical protein
MILEYFDIHNIIKFQLRNNNIAGFLKNTNPEYKYFTVDEHVDPDFRVTVSKTFNANREEYGIKHAFKKRYPKWEVEILEYENGFVDVTIIPYVNGVRKFFEYSALKNLYVRSLLYYCLIRKGCTLIHSSAVNIKDEAYVFIGRPGAFKTSIIMDLLRQPETSFLGEENVLLSDEKIYPFPLNIHSLNHKIKYYKNEDPPSVIHKLFLGLSLLKNKTIDIPISKPCKTRKIFFLEKKNKFECIKNNLEDLIDKLILNEVEEIDITPTHTFSGISNNCFSEYLHEIRTLDSLEEKLRNVFIKDISNVDMYSVSMPSSYEPGLISEFLKA